MSVDFLTTFSTLVSIIFDESPYDCKFRAGLVGVGVRVNRDSIARSDGVAASFMGMGGGT